MTESCHSGLRLPGDGHEMIEINPTIPNDIRPDHTSRDMLGTGMVGQVGMVLLIVMFVL
jgi:hypothetical protein